MDSGWQLGHSCLPGAFLRDSRTQLAILQNPISADEHRYLGQALLLVHRQQEAVRELRLAVHLDPDSPLAHYYLATLATALFDGQDSVAAEAEFRQAVRLQPT